ncbi:MAG: amidase family protein [Bacteroidota bacterium]
MTFEEYRRCDASELAQLVKDKEITAGELLDIAIERIEAVNPSLNAIVHKLYDHGREMLTHANPEAPFYGVPFLVKDLGLEVAQTPMLAGSKALKGYISPADTYLSSQLKDAGFIFIAKTNTPELGLTSYTESELNGACLNPWNLAHSPGGSSGGSAAAVASGIAPLATASDGGGSIRIPAACCGLFGLKPSRGRTSLGPKHGEMWGGAVVENCVSRSVRDSAAYLDLIQKGYPGDPYLKASPESFLKAIEIRPKKLRIGYSYAHILDKPVAEKCKAALLQVVELLKGLGHEVEEVALPYTRDDIVNGFLPVIAGETAASITEIGRLRGKKIQQSELERNTWAMGLLGRTYSAEEYALAKRVWGQLARRMGAFHQQHDLLLTPTLTQLPIETGALQNSTFEDQLLQMVNRLGSGTLLRKNLDQLIDKAFTYIPYTPMSNMTGQPSASIPLSWDDSTQLPIGSLFTAAIGQEALLYQLAAQLEEQQPWKMRFPSEL